MWLQGGTFRALPPSAHTQCGRLRSGQPAVDGLEDAPAHQDSQRDGQHRRPADGQRRQTARPAAGGPAPPRTQRPRACATTAQRWRRSATATRPAVRTSRCTGRPPQGRPPHTATRAPISVGGVSGCTWCAKCKPCATPNTSSASCASAATRRLAPEITCELASSIAEIVSDIPGSSATRAVPCAGSRGAAGRRSVGRRSSGNHGEPPRSVADGPVN